MGGLTCRYPVNYPVGPDQQVIPDFSSLNGGIDLPEKQRSQTLGLSSAAGSLGTLVVPLATQALLAREPWQIAALFFMLMGIAMLPAAYWADSADRLPGHNTATASMRKVLGQVRNRRFLVMSGAFSCAVSILYS